MRHSAKVWMFSVVYWIMGIAWVNAHDERIAVVVDTDMALDDVRAITLLLCSRHVSVNGIVTSDGGSSPEVGARNLQRILHFLERDDIPIGVGRGLGGTSPEWREQSESLGWCPASAIAEPEKPARLVSAHDALEKALQTGSGGVTYVCLGPLSNLAAALDAKAAWLRRIRNVIYYGSAPGVTPAEWNTTRDEAAAKRVFTSGLRIAVLPGTASAPEAFDRKMLESLAGVNTSAARLIALMHHDPRVAALVDSTHMKIWDEMAALYLENPKLATWSPLPGSTNTFSLNHWDAAAAEKVYLGLLTSGTKGLEERHSVMFLEYPVDPELFRPDLRDAIPSILALHGLEEWKVVVLTNELHRHLGIYSIIGAKMGIRARELFHAGLDDLQVESRAGSKPPLSCINDGLQTSTGASLGRGTISIPQLERSMPEALFHFDGRTLRLGIKPSLIDSIRKDIGQAIKDHGNLTPEYFQQVRRLSITYWQEMNRAKIFDEEWVE